jgi:hypothetical protein
VSSSLRIFFSARYSHPQSIYVTFKERQIFTSVSTMYFIKRRNIRKETKITIFYGVPVYIFIQCLCYLTMNFVFLIKYRTVLLNILKHLYQKIKLKAQYEYI